MEKSTIVSLLRKYQSGELTPKEQTELQLWANRHPANQALVDRAANGPWLGKALLDYVEILNDDQGTAKRLTQRIVDPFISQSTNPLRLRKWLPYAAAAALILAIATWFYTETGRQLPADSEKFADIPPG